MKDFDLEEYSDKQLSFLTQDEIDDKMYVLQLLNPGCVYSHETAAMMHKLSRFSPFRDYMFVPKGYNTMNLKENNIVPFEVSEVYFPQDNVIEKNFLGNNVLITNIERTIIDILSSEHSMGEIQKEVVVSYLDEEQKNLDRLKRYADLFGLQEIVKERILKKIK